LFSLRYSGLNSGPSPWATPPALFLWRVFQDRVLQTSCPSWLWTTVLLISASHVARITGVSHQCPAWFIFIPPCAHPLHAYLKGKKDKMVWIYIV
jgi:hypothetical protein